MYTGDYRSNPVELERFAVAAAELSLLDTLQAIEPFIDLHKL